jgi:hydroxymethylpyrimidine pyrophosphatase-like HAD family hydrolase
MPMRYLALATDYDGTLATHGLVDPHVLDALDRLAASGRKLVLVTGRELDDLLRVFPRVDRFDAVVAENGALLFRPDTGARRALAPPPPPEFVAELRRRAVAPLSTGVSVVATWEPHETTVLDVIRDLGLELQVIFNKGAVMVLPPGVNKSTGLRAALAELGLSAHNVVAIGDAENDHALLEHAELSAAVANAVPMLKAAADLTTRADHGDGVVELIDALLENDLAHVALRKPQRLLELGTRRNGEAVLIPASGLGLLVAGTSGSGKSTISTSLLEQLIARHYQCCVIDPEGDYDELAGAIRLVSPERSPELEEMMTALERPDATVVVNLLGLALADRPRFCATILSRLQEMRARTGRPHWILLDEAHHLLPVDWQPADLVLGDALSSIVCVTVHPESVAAAVLRRMDVLALLGDSAERALQAFALAADATVPPIHENARETGEALLWLRRTDEPPFIVRARAPQGERRRHKRKYAHGELGPDRSFYFRGPQERLNLRAQNLMLFLQIADGVDDETWLHHLRHRDYSRWLDESVKDSELARAVSLIESETADQAASLSRDRIRAAIEEHYTLPAEAPKPPPKSPS